jgi:antitoxin ParD1/3/4
MDRVEKLSISLPASLARAVRQRVKTGAFASNSEVVRDALRMWQEREAAKEQQLALIRRQLDDAIDDPRRSVPIDKAFDAVRKRHLTKTKPGRRAK